MLKKFVLHLWSIRHQFSRYFIIGLSAVALDMLTLYIFKQYLRWHPVTSVIVNQIFIINYVFFLNKYWAFKSKGMARLQIVRFYAVMTANYVFAIAWMWFFYTYLSWHYPLLIRAGNVALAVSWNFLLYKYWVYRVLEASSFAQS